MKLLGKLGIFLIFLSSLYGANIKVSSSQILKGEAVEFELSASGGDIEFPDISSIDGVRVQSVGSGINYSNINGKTTTIKTNKYIFYPEQSTTIPAFVINVDGKEQYTQPVQIKIVSQEKMNNKLPYSVSLHVSDKNPYVNQMIKLEIELKIDERLNVGDLKISGIGGLDKFWTKEKPTQQTTNIDGYVINRVNYWISPLKDGNLTIGPVGINIGITTQNRDPFGGFFGRSLRYKSIKSNTISLHVKPLQGGAKVAGDFTIEAIVDKSEVKAGKPVNAIVHVKGYGNLEELESLKQDIDSVIIYDDKPQIKSKIIGNKYESTWSQKIAYIGSKDFTIAPFSLTFFDTKLGKNRTIKTDPISIRVDGKVAKSVDSESKIIKPTKIKSIVETKNVSYFWIIGSFILGLCLGVLFSRVDFRSLLPKRTKIFKNDKEFLQEMLAYKGKNRELDEWILKLEENIYKNKKHHISKQIIYKLIKNFKNK